MNEPTRNKIAKHAAAKLLGKTSCAQCQFLWFQEKLPEPCEAWAAYVNVPHCAISKAFLEDGDRNRNGILRSRCPEFSQRVDPHMRTLRREYGTLENSHDLRPHARKIVMADIRKHVISLLERT